MFDNGFTRLIEEDFIMDDTAAIDATHFEAHNQASELGKLSIIDIRL